MAAQSLIGSDLSRDFLELMAAKTLYGGLHYAFPTLSNPLVTEVVGGSYARVPVVLDIVNDRLAINAESLYWGNLAAVTVVAVSLWDANVNGNFQIAGALAVNHAVLLGGSVSLAPGDVVFPF